MPKVKACKHKCFMFHVRLVVGLLASSPLPQVCQAWVLEGGGWVAKSCCLGSGALAYQRGHIYRLCDNVRCSFTLSQVYYHKPTATASEVMLQLMY